MPAVYVWLPVIAIPAFGGLAVVGAPAELTGPLSFMVIAAGLIAAVRQPELATGLASSAISSTVALYLALPVLSAVSLRAVSGEVDRAWLSDLAAVAALGWPATPRGLAWVLLTVLIVWVGDSAAYLGGRAVGRRPLAPRVSPNKTIEGAAIGLSGAVLTATLGNALFGLDLPPLISVGIGLVLGVISQLGDLVESLVKRRLQAKDSGTLIPGHGGVLDRIDSLFMAFPAAWLLAILVEGSR